MASPPPMRLARLHQYGRGGSARDAVTLSFRGNFGKAHDLRRCGVPGCLGRLYRHIYRLHQLVREGRQHFDVLSCVLYRIFHGLFQEIPLDRGRLLSAGLATGADSARRRVDDQACGPDA